MQYGKKIDTRPEKENKMREAYQRTLVKLYKEKTMDLKLLDNNHLLFEKYIFVEV